MHRARQMKIGAVTMFAMAQAALAREHTSRRSADIANAADRAIQCNGNRHVVTNSLSNTQWVSLAGPCFCRFDATTEATRRRF